jgi:hypothetical protein
VAIHKHNTWLSWIRRTSVIWFSKVSETGILFLHIQEQFCNLKLERGLNSIKYSQTSSCVRWLNGERTACRCWYAENILSNRNIFFPTEPILSLRPHQTSAQWLNTRRRKAYSQRTCSLSCLAIVIQHMRFSHSTFVAWWYLVFNEYRLWGLIIIIIIIIII